MNAIWVAVVFLTTPVGPGAITDIFVIGHHKTEKECREALIKANPYKYRGGNGACLKTNLLRTEKV